MVIRAMRAGASAAAMLAVAAGSMALATKGAQTAQTAKPENIRGRAVLYAPAPDWVIAPPAATDAPLPPGAPVRVLYVDQQVRVTADGQEDYQTSRIKLLSPEGLGAGNLAVAWSPASEEMIVHRLAVIRGGQTIDILATQKFTVIQRENNLEQSMLHGDLTATLQTAGLQVGDEIVFAATKRHRDTGLGERPEGFLQLPVTGMRGAYRVRLLTPRESSVAYRATADTPQPAVRALGNETERQYVLTDPDTPTVPEDAPLRYRIARLVQFSGYGDWAAVSRGFDPLYVRAGVLAADSPVKAEAVRIAATTTDPARRVEAALRVVQDQIRYVYVGLDGGNYRPAAADETWKRRFGDCKAKTVLLIALLREMGIAAEPVLVASKGGDGIDQRLPTPSLFDHVVVRATVAGKPVWLDGTRLGDRALATLDPPGSRWALALRTGGAALEPIAPRPPRVPTRIDAVEIDASAGFDKPGKYRLQQTLRGDEIFAMRAQLAGVAASDANKLLAAYWRQQMPDVEPSRTGWRFDEDNRLLVLDMEGEGKVDWDGDEKDGHIHYLFAGGFTPPSERKRPKDQPQDAPFANDYPAFTCSSTTVKVPPAGKGLHWTFSSKPMDRSLGGVAYWRIASFDGQTARMVRSYRVDVPEISAADAAALNAAIPGFDNNKSYVWETKGKPGLAGQIDAADHFGSFAEFAGATPPCQSDIGRARTS
ncbi:DUF3857 domain-containing transglutaminase family protein [Sphingomonas sp.]|uniref:DUF3857 domain-containing transglutaminase family protein n=1 Tax=Sphingomonas sp. TaxID=28214 RepID=UPI0035B31210